MRNIALYTLGAAAALLLLHGCKKNNNAATGAEAQEYIQLWMQEYHPGISANANGVYILEDQPGTGAEWDSGKAYSLLNITIRSLDGKITSTGHESFAKQLGTYQTGNYYGPKVTDTQKGYAGVESVLKGMREGGTRTAVVPSWLLTTSRYSTQQEYLDACPSTTHLIYTITFSGQTEDVQAWEIDRLKNYVRAQFGSGALPVSFNDATSEKDLFYFIPDESGVKDKTEIGSGVSYKLNYTGMLLNGQVFDTTIEKVAKDNGIYDSSRTYEPVTIKTAEEVDSYTLGGSSGIVTGFKGGLSLLKYEGHKGVALFTSDLGYTSTGSGNKIPGYAPLRFDLEVVSIIKE